MPKARYEGIYRELRDSIQGGLYAYRDLLPTEKELTTEFSCSRNTLRRALSMLADEAFVQPIHGKGVRVIWREETPNVRKDFGYPPLVTPTSQIVGSQAVLNVLSGERYKMVSKESKALLRGEYGRLPAPVNEEVRKKCIGDDKVITHRPADDIPPELDKYREEIRDYYQQEEDVLSYALFPQVAIKYFQYRQAKQMGVDSTMLNKEEKTMPV